MKPTNHLILKSSAERAFKAHADTNHFYNDDLPYSFHLQLAMIVGDEFDYLLEDNETRYVTKIRPYREHNYDLTYLETVKLAIPWHDAIEDARYTYNDVVKEIGKHAADIVYAVTNLRGKNRDERANDEYYKGILETPGATYVKLCDRIANLRFGKLMGSIMTEKYRKEYPEFIRKLHLSTDHDLYDMAHCIEKLLFENTVDYLVPARVDGQIFFKKTGEVLSTKSSKTTLIQGRDRKLTVQNDRVFPEAASKFHVIPKRDVFGDNELWAKK